MRPLLTRRTPPAPPPAQALAPQIGQVRPLFRRLLARSSKRMSNSFVRLAPARRPTSRFQFVTRALVCLLAPTSPPRRFLAFQAVRAFTTRPPLARQYLWPREHSTLS